MNRCFSRLAVFRSCLFLALLLISTNCLGKNWDKIIRKGAGVVDDIPLKHADEFVESLAGRPAIRQSLSRRLDDFKALDDLAKSRRIAMKLDEIADGLGPETGFLLRSVDDVDKPAALIIADGIRRTKKQVPDIARRSEFLGEGGVEMITAAGLHGDDAIQEAVKLKMFLDSGKLVSPPGSRAATIRDFGRFLSKGGDEAWGFWRQKVIPHWDKWLVGGALSAFLINPDAFINATGKLTENGIDKLTELAGHAVASAIAGVKSGSEKAAKEAAGEVFDWKFLYAIPLIAIGILLLIGRSRRWLVDRARAVFGTHEPETMD